MFPFSSHCRLAGSASVGGSQWNDLVRKTVQETALMMHKTKEEIEEERKSLYEGNGLDAEKVRKRAEAQLMKHTQEVGGYVKEVDALVERAQEALERQVGCFLPRCVSVSTS